MTNCLWLVLLAGLAVPGVQDPRSATSMPTVEQVLAAAAHLQRILPGAVLVGGSAASVYAAHRLSTDADHVLTDLRPRFDQALAELREDLPASCAAHRRPLLHL